MASADTTSGLVSSLHLRLYVNGGSVHTSTVEHNLRSICDDAELEYDLEVVDVTTHPERAEDDRIMVTPTLIRLGPAPVLRVAGDLSDVAAALDGLGLRVWHRRARRAEPWS